MSHAEHHPERDTEENEPINFEWTPELVKIGTSRDDIHPPRLVPTNFTRRATRTARTGLVRSCQTLLIPGSV